MIYNVIRWPDSSGDWWLVAETGKDGSYTPLMTLYPKWTKGQLLPTYNNQLWCAAEVLVNKGLHELENPHAATGRMCGCGDCFCCAANRVANIARELEYSAANPTESTKIPLRNHA